MFVVSFYTSAGTTELNPPDTAEAQLNIAPNYKHADKSQSERKARDGRALDANLTRVSRSLG